MGQEDIGGCIMSAEAYNFPIEKKPKKRRVALDKKRQSLSLSKEDIFILTTLEKIKSDLELIHASLDMVTDPDLIDSFIYEINALNTRYKFYLQLCKERDIVSAMF